MITYAETSAVLSWLLGEAESSRVEEILDQAELVVASRLTLVESRRALHRVRTQTSSEGRIRMLEHRLRAAAATWLLLDIGEEILEKASEVFPVEPVRTLDAIHLASAVILADALEDTVVVTLDRRMRANVTKLGLKLLPEPE